MSLISLGTLQLPTMIILGLFLLSCSQSTPSPDQIDKSPFTSSPCAAPCWHGIVIGESDESKVMSTLETLSFIDQESINVHRMSMSALDPNIEAEGVEITASCIQPHKPCLTLRVVDNLLTEIELILNYEIMLDEAIRYLGNPDYIGYQMKGAEQVSCDINLVWASKQLVLSSEAFMGSKISDHCYMVRDTNKTTPSLAIFEAKYMSPQAIELLLSTGAGEFFEFSGTVPAQ